MVHVYIAQVKFSTTTNTVGELRLKYSNRIQKIYICSTDLLLCRVRTGIVLYCNGLKVPGCVNPPAPSSLPKNTSVTRRKKNVRGDMSISCGLLDVKPIEEM